MLELFLVFILVIVCSQTLFFINCLNSRRREHRRFVNFFQNAENGIFRKSGNKEDKNCEISCYKSRKDGSECGSKKKKKKKEAECEVNVEKETVSCPMGGRKAKSKRGFGSGHLFKKEKRASDVEEDRNSEGKSEKSFNSRFKFHSDVESKRGFPPPVSTLKFHQRNGYLKFKNAFMKIVKTEHSKQKLRKMISFENLFDTRFVDEGPIDEDEDGDFGSSHLAKRSYSEGDITWHFRNQVCVLGEEEESEVSEEKDSFDDQDTDEQTNSFTTASSDHSYEFGLPVSMETHVTTLSVDTKFCDEDKKINNSNDFEVNDKSCAEEVDSVSETKDRTLSRTSDATSLINVTKETLDKELEEENSDQLDDLILVDHLESDKSASHPVNLIQTISEILNSPPSSFQSDAAESTKSNSPSNSPKSSQKDVSLEENKLNFNLDTCQFSPAWFSLSESDSSSSVACNENEKNENNHSEYPTAKRESEIQEQISNYSEKLNGEDTSSEKHSEYATKSLDSSFNDLEMVTGHGLLQFDGNHSRQNNIEGQSEKIRSVLSSNEVPAKTMDSVEVLCTSNSVPEVSSSECDTENEDEKCENENCESNSELIGETDIHPTDTRNIKMKETDNSKPQHKLNAKESETQTNNNNYNNNNSTGNKNHDFITTTLDKTLLYEQNKISNLQPSNSFQRSLDGNESDGGSYVGSYTGSISGSNTGSISGSIAGSISSGSEIDEQEGKSCKSIRLKNEGGRDEIRSSSTSSGDESASELSSSSFSSDQHSSEDFPPAKREGHQSAAQCKDHEALRHSDSDISLRERQVIQGLDDLIAGVPAPDYETTTADDLARREAPAREDGRRGGVSANRGVVGGGCVPPPKGYGDDDDVHDDPSTPPSLPPKTSAIPPPLPNPAHKALIRSFSTAGSSSVNSEHKNVLRTSSEPTHSNPPPPPPPPPPMGLNGLSSDDSSNTDDSEENGHGKQDLEGTNSVPENLSENCEEGSSSGKSSSNGKGMPFIPPKFPSQPAGHGLIKPSEYLRSLGDPSDMSLPSIPETKEEESKSQIPPPPPLPSSPSPSPSPASSHSSSPPTMKSASSNGHKSTTMPSISVTDLQSVHLRKTELKATRQSSMPLKIHTERTLDVQKNDIIAELKRGVDIDGIKKLKTEKIKEEINIVKKEKEELKKQFAADKFVEKMPEVDGTGNRIPDWKRQMLAKKAAEKAKKEAEEEKLKELEAKRMQNIPAWKRQLLAKKEEERLRSQGCGPGARGPCPARPLQPSAAVKL